MVRRDISDSEAGLLRGKHFTAYVDAVKDLKRRGEDEAVEHLLELVDATEAEARAQGFGVAPWYYQQLAMLYRKTGEPRKEVAILDRYSQQDHAPGVMPPKLVDRLAKSRSLEDRGA